MSIKVRRIAGIAVLSVGTLSAGLAMWPPGRSMATDSPGAAATFRVTKSRFVQSHVVSGELAAVRAVKITAPPFRGQGPFALKALAPEGSFVQPGDLLVQIDNSVVVSNLEVEETNLEKAENDLARKQAELEIQSKDLEIQLSQNQLQLEKTRLKAEIDKGLVALRDWQDYQFAFQKAQKEHDKTKASLEIVRKAEVEELALLRVKRDQIAMKIDGLKRNIEALEIRSDRPGTVLYDIFLPSLWNGETPRKVQAGDQVFNGLPLLTIPDLSEMEARIFVSEVDGGVVKVGQQVRMVADSHPGTEFAGRVQHIPGLAERAGGKSKARVFLATVKLDRTDSNFMRPGMSVRAEIVVAELEGTVVPRKAVIEDKGSFYVRLADGSRHPVKLRARNAVSCLIEGVSEGTEVRI